MVFPPSLLLIFILTIIKPSFSIDYISSDYARFYPADIIRSTTTSHSSNFYRGPMGFQRHTPSPTTSQSATITSSTNASQIQTSSAAPAMSTAASHGGAGDPCGPQGNQTDFESTINTCGQINTTYTDAPSIYGVQCLNANPSSNQSINTAYCASNIANLCGTINDAKATVSQWNWSSGGPNCTVGVWFNPLPAAQPSRTQSICELDIYQLMQSTCFPSQGGPFNVAAVNLQTLPDLVTNGSQVDSGYPSYIIVPETYNVN